jgi:hypothetical protein
VLRVNAQLALRSIARLCGAMFASECAAFHSRSAQARWWQDHGGSPWCGGHRPERGQCSFQSKPTATAAESLAEQFFEARLAYATEWL